MNPCVSCTSTFYQVATLGARRTDDGGEDSVVSQKKNGISVFPGNPFRIRSYGFGRSLWISEESWVLVR